MSLVSTQAPTWTLKGEAPDLRHLFIEVQASLSLPLTVNVGAGISETLHFAVHPRLDPEVKVTGGWLEIDLGQCPSYFGLTAPPPNLKPNAADQDREARARREFLSKLLKAAGDDLRHVVQWLLGVPGQVFAALRAQLPKYIDYLVGFLPDFLGVEESVKRRLDRLMHAMEERARQAMGWVMAMARDVAHALLTSGEELGHLTGDACRAVIEGLQVLYEGGFDGARRFADVVQESFVVMAKDAARYATQLRATMVGLVQASVVTTRDFAANVQGYVSTALAALIETYGTAEDKLTEFFDPIARAAVECAQKLKRDTADACDFFCRVLEGAVIALEKIADDPNLLYVWIGKVVRTGLPVFAVLTEAAIHWSVWAAHAMGRAARALTASVKGFAQKTAAELEPYVKPALKAIAEVAQQLGKMTRENLTAFLQKLAGWSRTVFHAVCRVLQAAEDLLIALVGPELLADAKSALKLIGDFLEEAGAQLNHAIDVLYRFGRYVAVELPRRMQELAAPVVHWLQTVERSISAVLHKLFEVALQVGGYVRSSWIVQKLDAIVGILLQFAESAGAAIGEKGRQLDAWLGPKLEAAMARVEDVATSLATLLEGTGDGFVLEARFRHLAIAPPRASRRSQARIEVLSPLPSATALQGDDILLPVLQSLAGAANVKVGALELFRFDDWRLEAPHPVSGHLELAPRARPRSRVLPVPFAPDKDVVFRLCVNPRLWVIDPRYSWGYGASNQIHLADIDGDGKVDEWEVWKQAQQQRDAHKKDPDSPPFTAADLQTMLDQAKNVLHGVPYRQIGAPFGILAAYEGGSWTWFSMASLGSEDVGAAVQEGTDPAQPVGSVLRAGAGGTVLPGGEKVDRTGLGFFWQGLQRFGPQGYPVRYHVEKRLFWDRFASGFANAGTSLFFVLRGGEGGNDFQLRSELYTDFSSDLGGYLLPTGMYTPTIRATWGFGANVGSAAAAQGGFRLGLEYKSDAPIAVLLGDAGKSDDEKKKGVVDEILGKLKEEFNLEEIVPLLEKAAVPVLRLLMFDQEFEAKLACAGAVAIGEDLAIQKQKTWAKEAEGRHRTLRLLEQAEVFFDDWKQSEAVRREEDALRAHAARAASSSSKHAVDDLNARVKELWDSASFNEEQRKDLTEIRLLYRAFMRFALKEPGTPADRIEDRFRAWLADSQPTAKLATLDGWLAAQRQGHYLEKAGHGAAQLKKLIWAGDLDNAWAKIKSAVSTIDATPSEYADELCESILALASLVDIFHRLAKALAEKKHLKKEIAEDIQKRRQEREEKATKQAPTATTKGHAIFGRLTGQAQDPTWEQDVLAGSPSWGKKGTGLADGVSVVWSIDGGIGVGAGGSAGGAGLGAFALAGISVVPAALKVPAELLAKLSSKLLLFRFGVRFFEAFLEVLQDAMEEQPTIPQGAAGLPALVLYWYVIAAFEVVQAVLSPGDKAADGAHGAEPDPLEDWLFQFLSGSVISVGAKANGLVKAVGTVMAAEAGAEIAGELTVTLASLFDPLVEALQQNATRDSGDKAALRSRAMPKFAFKVKQTLSASLALGPAQLDLGLTGQSLAADLVLPDGSPWRRHIEQHLSHLAQQALVSGERRRRTRAQHRQPDGFLHGLSALCRAVDTLLRNEIPSIMKCEKQSGDDGPGVATALVTNPSIRRMFDTIRDPAAVEKRHNQQRQRTDELITAIRAGDLHFEPYPEQPGTGVTATPTSTYSFDVKVLLPDGEVDRLSPHKTRQLARSVYRISIVPAPAHVAQDTFRRRDDSHLDPINGIVVGFPKKSEAAAFASSRDGNWIDSSLTSVPPWPSSRAGESGTAQWYHWLNTKLFTHIEEARQKGKLIEQPRLSVDGDGVLLTFNLVDRGLLDDPPFSSLGFVKQSEVLITEATVLEGAWEDDVVRFRTEVAAAIARGGRDVAEPAPTAYAAAQPAVPPGQTIDRQRYSVRRAQRAINHQVQTRQLVGWSERLAVDGRLGPKTSAALNRWAEALNNLPVIGSSGADSVEVGPRLAAALDGAEAASAASFASKLPVPENDAPWLAIARGEVGQRELGGAADNVRIRAYHASTSLGEKPDEVAWCSSFVNWCLTTAGVRGTGSAAAAGWTAWGQPTEPRRGAVIVIFNEQARNSGLTRSGNHVGFLIEDLGWGWRILGGNQGNMVKESCFSKRKWMVKALRWPT